MTSTPALDLDEYWGPARSSGMTGAGITVGVVDTGADTSTYEWSAALNQQARQYVGVDVPWGRIEKRWSLADVNPEKLKHGSEIFRRLLPAAPSAHFLDVRYPMPESTEQQLLQSIKAAVDEGADVINLSLGRLVPFSKAEEHIQTCSVCKYAARLASDHDVLVLAAVGNFGSQGMACPGISPAVLSVGAGFTPEVSAYYQEHPEKQLEDFLAGRAGTSYAAAMTSALYTVLRSAFPAIPAVDWIDFVRSNRAVFGATRVEFKEPEVLLSELRAICGGWSANSADWSEFAKTGFPARRAMLARAHGAGVQGYPELSAWLREQRERFRTLIDGQQAVAIGREKSNDTETLSEAIKQLEIAVAKFVKLGQNARTAATRTLLGAALVNRAWKAVPGQIRLQDASMAESQLSTACVEVQGLVAPHGPLEGSALAWRARARTLLAEVHPARNEDALSDAKMAVKLLSAEPNSKVVQHDLALAHLHFARALYWRVCSARESGRSELLDIDLVRQNASRALELGPTDGYVRADGNWLIEQLGNSAQR